MKLIKNIIVQCLMLLLAIPLTVSASVPLGDKKPKQPTEQQKFRQADLFAQAIIEREKSNYEEALKLIDKALGVIPSDAAANYEKARLLLQMGRKDEALGFAETAVENDNNNKWYKVLHARIAKEMGDYKTYVKDYETLVEQYPNDINFVQELAFAYYYTNDLKNAIKYFDRMEEIMGMNEGLTTQKADLYNKMGKNDMAVAEYEKLIKHNPNESRYYVLLAEYATKTKDIDKAIWAYKKVLELNPDDPFAHISLADFYRQQGNSEQSFEELKEGMANKELELKTKVNVLVSYYKGELDDEQKQQTLELSEILKKVHPDDALAETFYASMLYENKKYEEAYKIFSKMVESEGVNYPVWEQLLFCDLYLNDYNRLATDSEKALEFFPSYPLPWFFAGISYAQNKQYEKAIDRLEKGKEFVVNNNALLEQFYSSLGDAYNQVGNNKAAYDAFDKTLKLNPQNSIVLNNYAYYLSLEKKGLDKAAEMGKKAIELDPYNNNNLDTYAWVLFQQQKYHEALEWIKKAYDNGGDSSGVVNEHYGDILYKLGKTDEALKYWKAAKTKKEHSDLLDKKIKEKMFYE
ncbi:MAG: tetratricopeptide repeat protein [Chlorobi bacterium]|nr:tetratricopeptide repeat protein [Chlorobiota bacterium]